MQPTRARRALPLALLKARETVMSPIRRVLKNHDVTDQQWRVLRVLHENGVMDAKELAKSACVLAPSLTRMIKHLEQKKTCSLVALIAKMVAEYYWGILPSGAQLIESVTPEVQVIYQGLSDNYGAQNMSDLLDLLHDVVELK